MPEQEWSRAAIVVVTAEDDRFGSARARAAALAEETGSPVILYDWDAPSFFSEPLPTIWSSDGWDERFPGRLDATMLDGAGRTPIADQVRELRGRGIDAFGWLPSDHGPGALADYARRQGAAAIVIPTDLSDLGGLDAIVNGTASPAKELEEREARQPTNVIVA
ncbi:MAG TPA: hypothetical protein VLR93_08730 [Patescibacteria group bacterium]|nr:hypothetical protein [Patescibacteria group bacterium]